MTPLNCAMKKSDRIRDFVDQLQAASEPTGYEPRYRGYFTCFNAQKYYEAHDVLEDLWLQERGPDYGFYKGLIQLAGAFVHLKKQAARPEHPKDGRRLVPAARLFELASRNLRPYAPAHLGLDVVQVLGIAEEFTRSLLSSDFTRNPWHPDRAPQIAPA